MKIRQGFVSNSSSSSFCVIGVRIDDDAMDMVKQMTGVTDEEIFKKMADAKTTETIEDFCKEWLNELLAEKNMEIHYIGYERDEKVIGKYVGSWEYDSIEKPAQKEFDEAKKIIKDAGLSADDMKIFCSFSG